MANASLTLLELKKAFDLVALPRPSLLSSRNSRYAHAHRTLAAAYPSFRHLFVKQDAYLPCGVPYGTSSMNSAPPPPSRNHPCHTSPAESRPLRSAHYTASKHLELAEMLIEFPRRRRWCVRAISKSDGGHHETEGSRASDYAGVETCF